MALPQPTLNYISHNPFHSGNDYVGEKKHGRLVCAWGPLFIAPCRQKQAFSPTKRHILDQVRY